MPRPPTKRNRHTSHRASSSNKALPKSKESENRSLGNDPRSPLGSENDMATVTQPAPGVDLDLGQQLGSQTPMTKAQEQAIYSSPTGEREATGSRPPTRARGYSATLSVGRRRGDMSSRIPATPGFESSILSNFRRRPRQPSILQMMQADDGSSDLGDLDDDDFLGGLSPEDESTPLNLSRGKSLLLRDVSPLPSLANTLPSTGGSHKRKRAVEELQVPQSPLEVVEETPASSAKTIDEQRDAFGEVRRLEYSEEFSQTLAPPISSSPLSSPRSSHSTPMNGQRPTTTKDHTTTRNPQRNSDKIHMSTASLQDRLLPRRRQRHRRRRGVTDCDVSSDGSGDDRSVDPDEDELSYLPSRKPLPIQRRRKDGVVRPKRKKQAPATVVNSQVNNLRELPAQPCSTVKESRPILTYASQSCLTAGIDKENQALEMSSPLSSPLDSDAFELDSSPVQLPSATFLSDELKLQAKKFEEVDKWEMDFEDVVVSGSQDSLSR